MCGIVALASVERSLHNVGLVQKSVQQVYHRGPDGSNVVSVGSYGPIMSLGHTRLAVVGSDKALQPLQWTKGGSIFHLSFNGEVYNFRELKELLIIDGRCDNDDFHSEGDSEVLLACIANYGLDWTLNNIRGMYAFVAVELTDGEIKTITMCRDLFGIKPLSFAVDNSHKSVFISSEIAAIPDDFGIEVLNDVLPASYISLKLDKANIKWVTTETIYANKYAVLAPTADVVHEKSSGSINSCENIQSTLIDAVSIRIPQDDGLNWGVLLSGGLDSGLIAAIAADAVYPAPLYTFTIAFSDPDSEGTKPANTDKFFARVVSKSRENIVHKEITFDFQDGLDVLPDVIKAVETSDVAIVRASVPLFILSKYLASNDFKVILCGEGADELFAGYRLFENYDPHSFYDCSNFSNELERRLFNIDTSELQRVDRCTMYHGLEARVPFLDKKFTLAVSKIDHTKKMSHPSMGQIQKYILRKAFDGYLPDSVIYREKEQFADGIGSSWVAKLQEHASYLFPSLAKIDQEPALYKMHLHSSLTEHQKIQLDDLIEARKARRRFGACSGKVLQPGAFQPTRWFKIQDDIVLQTMKLSSEDAHKFLESVLGWSSEEIKSLSHDLESVDKLIVSMLSRVPFHNLTLLTRERRPPTPEEIKDDMMAGLGGPCSVVNSFFAVLLDMLGFGPDIYLLSCRINSREDCHVAILLQMKGLRYFIDVANAKPYNRAVQLGDESINSCLNNSFRWNLTYSSELSMMQLLHHKEHEDAQVAVEFHPVSTVQYSSFHRMIHKSRSDTSFGPFLTGLRICMFPKITNRIIAIRNACVYDGDLSHKRSVSCRDDLMSIAKGDAFAHIRGFDRLLQNAINILDEEHPDWFDVSREELKSRGWGPVGTTYH